MADLVIESGDIPIAVRDFGGDGPPLLLLPGGGGNLANLTVLAKRLRETHRVLAMDHRGHGGSGDGPFHEWYAAYRHRRYVAERPDHLADLIAGFLADPRSDRVPGRGTRSDQEAEPG